ncbi:hypothetical protein EUTSA_v10019819mg, partial [Eutrema salsugineum]
MVSHRKCGEVAKMRSLTRKFKTNVYGPCLRYEPELAGNDLPVKSHYSQMFDYMDCDQYEETVTYAQFFVVVVVKFVYASEHEWGGKKLVRSLLSNTLEIDKISPLTKLTAEDKASIVHGLVDHLMNKRKTRSEKRWVP